MRVAEALLISRCQSWDDMEDKRRSVMLPLSEIKIGDCFSNPMHRRFGCLSGLEWVVVDIKDGIIKLQPHRYSDKKVVYTPIWIRPNDRMLSESWRV